MATPIRMPQPGQMTEECTVLQWYKAVGDSIAKGDSLFEIETDKSNMDVEAFDEGTLLRIDVGEGQTVPVDAVVAWIGEAGEEVPAEPASGAPAVASAEPSGETQAESPETEPSDVGPAEPEPTSEPGTSEESRPPEPATPETEPPVTEPPTHAQPPASQVGASQDQRPAMPARRRLAISPRASRVAAELGVDPAKVTGTGPGGRIIERDVRAAAATADATRAPVAATPASPVPAGGEPMSRIRQVIARRLTESVTTIPQFSVTVAVDVTGLMRLRAEIKALGSAVTLTDFIDSAAVQALMELPLVNARTDGTTLWRRDAVHLGIAVAIPAGLLVPVIRDAQELSIGGLHDATVAAVEGARAGTLGPDELSGSTFTVSNMGMFGVEEFSAIINPGESAILAVSSVQPEAAVVDGGIAIRQRMRLTLTSDHRIVDGELAARFLNAMRKRLEDASTFRLQV